jgi:hypothetical protein
VGGFENYAVDYEIHRAFDLVESDVPSPTMIGRQVKYRLYAGRRFLHGLRIIEILLENSIRLAAMFP